VVGLGTTAAAPIPPETPLKLSGALLSGMLAGARTQEEAAEDPLTAALAGAMPDYSLYWTNKLAVRDW